MELKEYIKEVVSSINLAIKDLQENNVSNEVINPKGIMGTKGVGANDSRLQVSDIEFNIVISKELKEESKSGLGVMMGHFNIGCQENDGRTNNSVNSIRFSIPIIFPYQDGR
jgi:formylmethanofuran dehydrogenase subunit B